MNDRRFFVYIVGLMMSALFLTACGAASEAMVPTATFTPELPTATPPVEPTDPPAATETPVTASTPESLLSVVKTEDIVYARRTKPNEYEWKLDEYTPSKRSDWPVVIFIHGSAGKKSDYQYLGQALAEQGVAVFIISYPDMSPIAAIDGNARGYREMTETTACAIRYAHARASEAGNETPSVTIVGFSLGGGIGSYVALVEDNLERRWEGYAALKGGKPESQTVCDADDSIAVDALVGISGDYDAFVGSDGKHGLEEWLQAQDNELWQMLHSAIGENPDIRIRLIHGAMDFLLPYENAAAFETTLAEAGYDVALIQFSEGHRVPVELTIQTIMDVVKE